MSIPAGDNVYELHRAWPKADYAVVHDSGHSAMDPGILGIGPLIAAMRAA